MKNLWITGILVLVAGLQTAFAGETAVEGRVNASKLNLRLSASLQAPVVVKLPQGAVIKVLAVKDNWIEVAAPAECDIFAPDAMIIDGKARGETFFRNHWNKPERKYGKLHRNDTVTPLGERKHGWIKIAPPAGFTLFAAKLYVDFDENALLEMKAKEAAKPADAKPAEVKSAETKKIVDAKSAAETKKTADTQKSAEVKKPVETKKPAETLKTDSALAKKIDGELKALRIDSAKSKPVTLKGQLAKLEKSTSVVTDYYLWANNVNAGFLFSRTVDLKANCDKIVEISGKKYEVSGWDAPVIEVTSIKVAK